MKSSIGNIGKTLVHWYCNTLLYGNYREEFSCCTEGAISLLQESILVSAKKPEKVDSGKSALIPRNFTEEIELSSTNVDI